MERAQLTRILAIGIFSNPQWLTRFLRFVAESAIQRDLAHTAARRATGLANGAASTVLSRGRSVRGLKETCLQKILRMERHNRPVKNTQ
jgi:hypothetical protein